MASSARRGVLTSAVVLLCAASAGAQTTALFLDSEQGDYVGAGQQRTLTPADGTFTVTEGYSQGVRISFRGASPGHFWYLDFHGPRSARLGAAAYNGALRAPFTPFTGMSVGGDGRGCNVLTGRFLVREIAYVGSTILRLAIDFEQHCENAGPGLFGAVRYNSTISTLVPFDGVYPLYHLEMTPPEHGIVTGTGLDCGGPGTICGVTLPDPGIVTVTATPDSGYMFAGWGGTCYGGLTTSFFVNAFEQCSALFVPAPYGAPTLASFVSQAGEPIRQGATDILNPTNSVWTVRSPSPASVMIDVEGIGSARTTPWHLVFQAPTGHVLIPGLYDDADDSPVTPGPTLDVSANHVGCSAQGSFIVHEFSSIGEVVTSLAIDFEQHCGGVQDPPRPLRGSVRYSSSVPTYPTLAVRVNGSRGQVSLNPGDVCTANCLQTYLAGTAVQLTAVPHAGFTFAGWQGDADCLDGIVSMAAPTVCEAVLHPVVSALAVGPASGTNVTQVFALDYSSAAGATDIATAWVWFNPALASTAANSCLVYYYRPTNRLRLLNDAGTLWGDVSASSSSSTLENSQCRILPAMSSISSDGAVLRVNLAVQFKSGFAGSHRVYLFAASGEGVTSGWQERGTWVVPTPDVMTGSVLPDSGTGTSQTFALTYTNTYGAGEVTTAWVWFNATLASSAAGSCLAYLENATNRVFLLDDAAAIWNSGALGSSMTLQNSQCAIHLGSSSVDRAGNTLTLTLTATFKGVFAGTKHVYLFAQNVQGHVDGWHQRGTWTVPTPPSPVASAVGVAPGAGAGAAQSFVLDYAFSQGAVNLSSAWAWFTPAFGASAANSCLVYYAPGSDSLFLLNDAGTVWQQAALSSSGTLQNSRCSVAATGSSATFEGTTLRLTLAMTFTAAHAGPLNVFLFAAGPGATSGWHDRGDWTVTTGPSSGVTADAATPSTGTGTTQTFAFAYSSAVGAANLHTVWVWFHAAFGASSAGSCLLHYDRISNTLYLLNDVGTVWQPASLGSTVTLQNSQCALDVGGTSVALNGNTLTLTVPMTFTPAYAGTKQIYLFAATAGGAVSGWVDRGDWVVP